LHQKALFTSTEIKKNLGVAPLLPTPLPLRLHHLATSTCPHFSKRGHAYRPMYTDLERKMISNSHEMSRCQLASLLQPTAQSPMTSTMTSLFAVNTLGVRCSRWILSLSLWLQMLPKLARS